MYSPVYYIVLQLRDIGFSEDEIFGFLIIVYNASCIPCDIETQIANTNNPRYIWAFSLLDEDIYGVVGGESIVLYLTEYLNEYINILNGEYLITESGDLITTEDGSIIEL